MLEVELLIHEKEVVEVASRFLQLLEEAVEVE